MIKEDCEKKLNEWYEALDEWDKTQIAASLGIAHEIPRNRKLHTKIIFPEQRSAFEKYLKAKADANDVLKDLRECSGTSEP